MELSILSIESNKKVYNTGQKNLPRYGGPFIIKTGKCDKKNPNFRSRVTGSVWVIRGGQSGTRTQDQPVMSR